MRMFRTICAATAIAAAGLLSIGAAQSQDYPAPKPLKTESQAPIKGFGGSKGAKIAYMPPATEFNYYIAIGEGVRTKRPSTTSRHSCSLPRAERTSTPKWA